MTGFLVGGFIILLCVWILDSIFEDRREDISEHIER